MFPPMPSPPALDPVIRPAEVDTVTLDAMVRFLFEHTAESGRDGSPHFSPAPRLPRNELRENLRSRWLRGLDEPLWGRAWLLWSSDAVIGHAELRGGRIPAELHRATLGMGIRRAFTAQGHGPRLLDLAVRWAREEAGLAWIDLGVFAGNVPAQKLYRRAGFVEQGTKPDAFRLEGGQVIDDILMTLDLRPPAP